MNPYQQRKFDSLYQQHLKALRGQGKSPSTIDVYARAVRRIAEYFDRSTRALSFDELSQYFDWLIGQPRPTRREEHNNLTTTSF